jgi:hypothetical protein
LVSGLIVITWQILRPRDNALATSRYTISRNASNPTQSDTCVEFGFVPHIRSNACGAACQTLG